MLRSVPNIAGSSVDTEQVTPRRDQRRQRVLRQRGDRACAQVGYRADVEHDAELGQLGDQIRVLDGPDAVPDPHRVQRSQRRRGSRRAPATSPACGTPRDPSVGAPARNAGGVGLWRVLRLKPAQAQSHHATVHGRQTACPRGQPRAASSGYPRGMSGVSLTCTPCSSRACWAPSQ